MFRPEFLHLRNRLLEFIEKEVMINMYLKKEKKQSDNEHNCELLFILTIVIGPLFLCV